MPSPEHPSPSGFPSLVHPPALPRRFAAWLVLGVLLLAGGSLRYAGLGRLVAADAPPAVSSPSSAQELGSRTNYTLRTGDRLQYRLAEDPERGPTPIPVDINNLGEASFPVSRNFDLRITFEVRGKTVEEVREQLRERLLADYYNKATVELTLADKILDAAKVQFFGTGMVRGEIAIPRDGPPLTLSDALLRVNPPEFANLRKVKIHRPDPLTGQVKVIEVDANAVIKNGQRDKDVVLQDGDRIEVPEKWIN